MSFFGSLLERRASPENPSTNLANPASWLWDAFGAKPSSTGIHINERTALQSTAVYACIRILAETLASLPLQIYRRRASGGKDAARDHALYTLLHDRPNPEMSSFGFRETLMGHCCGWGNAYAEIEMSNRGHVRGLWPLRPDVTVPKRVNGAIVYETKINRETVVLPRERVLHIPGLGFDGLVGYSPVALMRQAIGLALATEDFGAKFFGNGSRPGGVLSHPARLSPDAKERLREGWNSAYGGLTNAQRVAVLEEGVTWTAIGTPPEDAQFLETRKFQVTEIARIYRVPPHMLADLDRATFSNIEHQSIEFVMHTLRPWLVRWEQILNYALFSDRDQGEAFCEFNVEGLLRGDSTQRSAFYAQLWGIGVLSPNEIRERENMNPVEGGDIRVVPMNMTSLEHAGEPPVVTPPPEPDEELEEEEDDADERTRAQVSAMRAIEQLLGEVATRMARREITQVARAVKRGREPFAAWVDEFYAEHREAVARALDPVLRGIALFGPVQNDTAADFARHHAAALAVAWTSDRADLLRSTSESATDAEAWAADVAALLNVWEAAAAAGVNHAAHRVAAALHAETRTLISGRAA